jgi:thiamine biosynthesis lipoprotein
MKTGLTGVLFGVTCALLVCGASPTLSAAQSQPVMYRESRRLMWTKFEIIAYGQNRARLAEAANAAFDEIERLDRQMSNYSETSELSYINRNAAREEVIVEKELFDFLQLSIEYSRTTGGAFDITVGPLMKTWGFFDNKGRVPDAGELKSVTERVGFNHVLLNERMHSIRFDREGVELDLGGIAKGYAVDKAAEILRASGVASAFITAGSAASVRSAHRRQTSWRVEVSDPLDRSHKLETIDLSDRSVSTSGCREKTFESGGKTFCHIMDPRIGRPVRSDKRDDYYESGVEAEALSKALLVMGIEKAREFLKTRRHVRALLFYQQPEGRLGCARLNF